MHFIICCSHSKGNGKSTFYLTCCLYSRLTERPTSREAGLIYPLAEHTVSFSSSEIMTGSEPLSPAAVQNGQGVFGECSSPSGLPVQDGFSVLTLSALGAEHIFLGVGRGLPCAL